MTESSSFGVFLAILPSNPSISPSTLKKECEGFTASLSLASSSSSSSNCYLQWTHHREPSLIHPQLSKPLPFLEISGKLTITTTTTTANAAYTSNEEQEKDLDTVAEQICNDICHRLNNKPYDSVIGNAELLLILPDTPIPLLDLKMPEDESSQTFNEYGLMVIRNAIDNGNDNKINNNDNYLMEHLYTLTAATFERLYKAMTNNPSKKLHYKEIMQRDKSRFDFRLDLDLDLELHNEVSSSWKELERRGKWKPLVAQILGDDYSLVKFGCVLSLPGTLTQYYHSDGVHVGKSATFKSSSTSQDQDKGDDDLYCDASPTHALCVFVPLIDLNEATGYTEFWAGSHKYSKLLSKKGMQALPGGHNGIINKGDVLLYDYRTIHRGMPNTSNRDRPVCYFLYSRKGMEHVEDQNFVQESVFD